jgi:hypothetical protein
MGFGVWTSNLHIKEVVSTNPNKMSMNTSYNQSLFCMFSTLHPKEYGCHPTSSTQPSYHKLWLKGEIQFNLSIWYMVFQVPLNRLSMLETWTWKVTYQFAYACVQKKLEASNIMMDFSMRNNYSFRLNVIGNFVDDLVAAIFFKQNCEFHELTFFIQQIKGDSL